MDDLQFISSVINSLAWPIALVTVVLVFKGPISVLLSRLSTLDFKGARASFSEDARNLVRESNRELAPGTNELDESYQRRIRLAEDSPRGAILEAWLDVEDALRELAGRYPLLADHTDSRIDIPHLIFKLRVGEHVGQGALHMLDNLYRLRNEAVHRKEKEIDTGAALDFIKVARRLVRIFEEA